VHGANAQPCLKLKSRQRFCPVSLSFPGRQEDGQTGRRPDRQAVLQADR
jgi:hypothetical protein